MATVPKPVPLEKYLNTDYPPGCDYIDGAGGAERRKKKARIYSDRSCFPIEGASQWIFDREQPPIQIGSHGFLRAEALNIELPLDSVLPRED